MNSQQKYLESVMQKVDEHLKESNLNTTFDRILANYGMVEGQNSKPEQYQIGIDTFARAEANMTKDEIIACCRFNIDKYTWRKKGQDLQDFKKIVDYANFAVKQLEK